MGNCINPHVATWLDDEERESEAEEERVSSAQFQGDQSTEQKTMTATSKERIILKDQVTIKMSKRQLEEVLRQADLRGVTVEQVLPEVMSAQGQQHERGALKSIRELPE